MQAGDIVDHPGEGQISHLKVQLNLESSRSQGRVGPFSPLVFRPPIARRLSKPWCCQEQNAENGWRSRLASQKCAAASPLVSGEQSGWGLVW